MITKICLDCDKRLSIGHFYKKRANEDISRSNSKSYCKTCNNKRARLQKKKTPQQNIDAVYKNDWKMKGIDLTRPEAIAQLEKQNYCCAICKDDLVEMPWHYDHNHRTLALREILCRECNRGMGLFQDDPHLLRLAAAYLERHK